MIKIRIEVQKIDYEKCLESLIPQLTKDFKASTNPTEVEKLIMRLGDDIVPVAKNLIGFLDTDTRDQIIVWLIEKLQDTIIDSANKALHDLLGVDAVILGTLYAQDRPGTKIALHAGQVRTDSSQLVNSPALTGFTGSFAL